MKKILLTDQFPKEGLTELFNHFEVKYPDKLKLTRDEVLELIPEFEIVLGGVKGDRAFFEKAKKLEFISNFGVGYDSIDINIANEKKVTVTNTPTSVTEATAELAMALMLSLVRRVAECDRKLRTDPNLKWGLMYNLGETLYGLNLGIIGLGRIGKAIARRAVTFGMKIYYHNRNRVDEITEKEYKATYLSKEELLKKSDVIVLALPLTKESFHIIGEKELSLMKKSSYIINIARGAIIDEKVLLEYLLNKKIAGAGLDVFENEPKVPEAFFSLDNVVLTPHIGTASYRVRVDITKEAANNIINYFIKNSPTNIVN